MPLCTNIKILMISCKKLINFFFVISAFIIILQPTLSKAEEEDLTLNAISDQLQIILKDIKTLEKAVYKKSDINTSGNSSNELNEDVLTRHLLKLNEIEDEFRKLTNRFEEVNFKLDKLSNRVTKIQSDTQLRFSDIESVSPTEKKLSKEKKATAKKKSTLQGSEKPQDFGSAPGYDMSRSNKTQATQSIESTSAVVTEEAKPFSSILPNKPSKDQYEFALGFMKIGDYETAEIALREFIDKNKDHELAGSAQYWYGETFRIRQLYSDAATAYLDGYQNYPKSVKAPENLLKLGTTMVQLGEKDQGCKMITGVKKQYPKASQSVLQKAQYEQKRFKCSKT